MKLAEETIEFGGQTLVLNNQRTIFMPSKNALILSDLHLGKAAHFRKNGIAVPSQVGTDDLKRLGKLIDHYQATNIIIVGDMIHAGINREVVLFKQFIANYSNVNFNLIKGNHDRLSTMFLNSLGIQNINFEMIYGGLKFVHHPKIDLMANTISGHLHPGISIDLTIKKRLKLPCFVVTKYQIILPAFSLFTGLDTMSKFDQASFYAFNEDFIFKLK